MWRRNRLVHLLMEKEESDRMLLMETNQRYEWYSVNTDKLEPGMQAKFQQSNYDEETEQFLNQSLVISNSIFLQLYYSVMATLLSIVFTKTSINGLLGRGGMFIFSHVHLRTFLGLPDDWSPIDKHLIDVGAGDGGVTLVMKQFFDNINVVEASKVMEWRLSQHGFKVVPLDKFTNTGPYNLISALNLLDRHYDPDKLLSNLHQMALESNCPVLLSVVLPLQQFVEFNLGDGGQIIKTTKAKRSLVFSRCDMKFEDQVNALVREVLEPAGFIVIRWTKLPYLCEGDFARAFYKLNDAVFLLSAVPVPKTTSMPVTSFTSKLNGQRDAKRDDSSSRNAKDTPALVIKIHEEI